MTQASLFEGEVLEPLPLEAAAGLVEALQGLFAPEKDTRRRALDRLRDMDAHRRSPLAAAVLVHRLVEPDLDLRAAIVDMLAEVLPAGEGPVQLPAEVRRWARAALAELREPQVYALLLVARAWSERFQAVCRLLAGCSFSGEILLRILKDRRTDPAVQAVAARAVGEIGYLDAIEELERLLLRQVSRHRRQLGMAFAPRMREEEEALVPALQEAMAALREAAG